MAYPVRKKSKKRYPVSRRNNASLSQLASLNKLGAFHKMKPIKGYTLMGHSIRVIEMENSRGEKVKITEGHTFIHGKNNHRMYIGGNGSYKT